MAMNERSTERSIPELMHSMVGNLQEIVRSEVRLAKTEVKEEAAKAGTAFALLGAGLLFAIYAIGLLLLAIVYALAMVLPAWAAAVIVCLVTGATAAVFLMGGKKALRRVHPQPERTILTMKENVRWAKQQVK